MGAEYETERGRLCNDSIDYLQQSGATAHRYCHSTSKFQAKHLMAGSDDIEVVITDDPYGAPRDDSAPVVGRTVSLLRQSSPPRAEGFRDASALPSSTNPPMPHHEHGAAAHPPYHPSHPLRPDERGAGPNPLRLHGT